MYSTSFTSDAVVYLTTPGTILDKTSGKFRSPSPKSKLAGKWRVCLLGRFFLDCVADSSCCYQGSQIRQNCSDDSTEVTEGVTLSPKIFGNKQGATSTREIFGNKHSFILTFFATNTIYVNCKCCKP